MARGTKKKANTGNTLLPVDVSCSNGLQYNGCGQKHVHVMLVEVLF